MFGEDDLVGFLKMLGYEAEKIPELYEEKRPDVIARASGQILLVELKNKGDDEALLESVSKLDDNKQYRYDSRAMGSHGPWGKIVGNGVDQLKAHPEASQAIKLMCVTCEGIDPEDQLEHLEQSLYGMRGITHDDSPEAPPEGPLDFAFHRPIATSCYYFAPSLFALHRKSLPGVLVQVKGEWQLLVNSIANDYEGLKSSLLYKDFSAQGAVRDPNDAATIDSDDFVIAPRTDGENDQSALARLAEKYDVTNSRTWPIRRNRVIGSYRIDRAK